MRLLLLLLQVGDDGGCLPRLSDGRMEVACLVDGIEKQIQLNTSQKRLFSVEFGLPSSEDEIPEKRG